MPKLNANLSMMFNEVDFGSDITPPVGALVFTEISLRIMTIQVLHA